MNFEIWNNELDVYEQEATSVDEGGILHLFDNGSGITMTINEGYILKETDDGYGKTIYRIEKKI